jgi:hypothetical protein
MGLLMRPWLPWTLALAALLGCGPSVSDDPGANAYLRVPGSTFVRGSMPASAPGAPRVASVVLVNAVIHPDSVGYPIAGALEPGATAAAVGLRGDVGYWIVPAGLPNVATPTDPSFAAMATFSSGIVPGGYTLVVQAVDAQGHFGSPSTQILTAQASPSAPAGDLVITLTWDTESDMDLHVVDPAGVEIFHGAMSDQPPPFAPQPEAGSYGHLDWDSNGNCVIDGKRQESVVWPNPPPPGAYVVRVDAASLCGQPIAHWSVEATLVGKSLGEAQGVALDATTRSAHDRGAGVTALELHVP